MYRKRKQSGVLQPIYFHSLSENIETGRIAALVVDEDILWVAGLNRLNRSRIASGETESVRLKNGVHITDVSNIIKYKSKLFGLSETLGLFFIEEHSLQADLFNDNPWLGEVLSSEKLKNFIIIDDVLFAGGEQGAFFQIHLQSNKITKIETSLNRNQVIYEFRTDSTGRLWLLTEDELFEYQAENQSLIPRLHARQVEQNAFYSFYIVNNAIWLGGNSRLTRYDMVERKAMRFGSEDGALNEEYNARVLDMGGNQLIFSTVNGVLSVDTEYFNEENNFSPGFKVKAVAKLNNLRKQSSEVDIKTEKFTLAENEMVRFLFAPSSLHLADQMALRYRLGNDDWEVIENWQLELNRLQLADGDNPLLVESSIRFANDWRKGFEVTVKFDKPFSIEYIHLVLIIALLLVIYMVIYLKYRQLVLSKTFESSKRLEVELANNKEKTKVHDIQSGIGQLKAQILKQKLIPIIHQLSPEQLNEILELQIQLMADIHLFDNVDKVISVKSFIKEILLNYRTLLDGHAGKLNIDLKSIQGKIPNKLIVGLFELSFFYASCFKQIASLSIMLYKTSARKGCLSILCRPYDVNDSQYFLVESILQEVVDFINKSAKVNACELEIRMNHTIFEWRLIFGASYKWVDQIKSKRRNINALTEPSRSDGQANKSLPLLFVLNLNEKSPPGYLFQDHFNVIDISIEQDPSEFDSQNATMLLVVCEQLDLFVLNILKERFIDKFDFIVVCYDFIDKEIQSEHADSEQILMLPLRVDSASIQYLVNYFYQLSSRSSLRKENNVNNENEQASQNYSQESINEAVIKSSDELFNSLTEFLEDHYSDEDLDVDKISEAMGMSSRHLNRKLREMNELPISEYLRRYRLKHALAYLREGYSIDKVRKMVGFSSKNYFSTCFKKYYGVKPSQYYKL